MKITGPFWVHAILKKEQLELIWNKMHACRDCILGLYWKKKKLKPGKCERKVHSSWNPRPATTGKRIGDPYVLIDWFQYVARHSSIPGIQPCCHHLAQIYTFNPFPFITHPHATVRLIFPTFWAHYIYSSLCSCLCNFSYKPHLSLSCPQTKLMIP